MFTFILVVALLIVGTLLVRDSENDKGLEIGLILLPTIIIGGCLECQAHSKPLDLSEVSVSVAKFGCNREPMTPQYACNDYIGRVSSEFDLRIFDVGYWNNNVHTEGLPSQVKTVGWHFELGVHLTPYLDTFYEHHSRHVMEGDQPIYLDVETDRLRQGRYPVEDSYGIRMKFYINPNPARSLLGG